jgi:hypothetical protein
MREAFREFIERDMRACVGHCRKCNGLIRWFYGKRQITCSYCGHVKQVTTYTLIKKLLGFPL